MKYYSSMDEDHNTNAGQADAVTLRQQAEQLVPKWKQALRKSRFRPHSWPLERVLLENKRFLDLGCGSGAKLFEFAGRGYEIWGVDVGVDAIRLCKDLLPQGHFFQGALQEADLPDNYFDYIRIDNALEHVPNPKEVIKECRRLLCREGQLMIYVPHGRSLSMRLLKGNSISAWIPFHLQLFTRKSLKQLLSKVGFKDIQIYDYNPPSWLPSSIMQWKYREQAAAKYYYPPWLSFACYPLGYLAAKCGLGEELVGIGRL
ncbi:MAG: class I SAM-dependent methyltransferase [Syntrophorhabdaceae bacterium]|nr:class I SAM-dependent methyltransferase [Syntrophorhabdaceae bacterium]